VVETFFGYPGIGFELQQGVLPDPPVRSGGLRCQALTDREQRSLGP
jgi:hypothetical protein